MCYIEFVVRKVVISGFRMTPYSKVQRSLGELIFGSRGKHLAVVAGIKFFLSHVQK